VLFIFKLAVTVLYVTTVIKTGNLYQSIHRKITITDRLLQYKTANKTRLYIWLLTYNKQFMEL